LVKLNLKMQLNNIFISLQK